MSGDPLSKAKEKAREAARDKCGKAQWPGVKLCVNAALTAYHDALIEMAEKEHYAPGPDYPDSAYRFLSRLRALRENEKV